MSDEKSESWAYLIPEFYFDLISRVPPGVLIIVAVAYAVMPSAFAFHQPSKTTEFEGPTVTLLLLLIGAGYACGILLTYLGSLIYDTYFRRIYSEVANLYPESLRRWLWKKIWADEKPFISNWESLSAGDLRLLYRRSHDYIKDRFPYAARLLPKLSAEGKLCDNVAAALLVITIAFPVIRYLSSGSMKEWWPLPVLIISCLYSWAAARHRFRRLAMGQFSYAFQLRDAEGQQSTQTAA
jgi:hypothetical protein